MWLIFLPHLLFAEGPPTEGPSLGLPLGIYTNHFGKVTIYVTLLLQAAIYKSQICNDNSNFLGRAARGIAVAYTGGNSQQCLVIIIIIMITADIITILIIAILF